MFETFDANHDGTVSFEELRLSLDALGRKPTEKQIRHMIEIVGGNPEAGINFEEFCQFMAIHADYLKFVEFKQAQGDM
jgi:Ca2+-binding EF-hand superfamily protein